MKLVIAEKPNLAKAIANALGKPKSMTGYFEVNDLYIVPLQGHILETAPPEEYSELYAKWDLKTLPIVPNPWKLVPNKSSRGSQRLNVIRELAKKCDGIIHAGDPDHEGQLLVDEVIHHLGLKLPVQRISIADLSPKAIQKSYQKLEDNNSRKWQSMHDKALARQRGDWLLGMNLSRLYSLLGQQMGLKGVLSFGRVQTATLGLVVERDIEIENFNPHDFFQIMGCFAPKGGFDFTAAWKPQKADLEIEEAFDTEGRLINPELFLPRLKSLISGPAVVLKAETKLKKQPPPLPFTLSELQAYGSKRLGLTLQATLDVAQALYDKHNLSTYPRTDVAHLPDDKLSEAPDIARAVAQNLPAYKGRATDCDFSRKTKAWNSNKVKGHHGIIPTETTLSESKLNALTPHEKVLYEAICQRFLAQFFPDKTYNETSIEIGAPDAGSNSDRFATSGRVPVDLGWGVVFGEKKGEANASQDDDEPEAGKEQRLPNLKESDQLEVINIITEAKKTQPPMPYTDATLVKAMNNIHQHVQDANMKKVLKEGDGIGTEATRASILEKLITDRCYLKRVKKTIQSTTEGRDYYLTLPEKLAKPDLAGLFDYTTKEVEAGRLSCEAFEARIVSLIKDQINNQQTFIDRLKTRSIVKDIKTASCRNCSGNMTMRKKKTAFWVCSSCNSLYSDNQGTPGRCFKGALAEQDAAEEAKREAEQLSNAEPCPACGAGLHRKESRTKKGKFFFQCSDRDCRKLYSDDKGKPGTAFGDN